LRPVRSKQLFSSWVSPLQHSYAETIDIEVFLEELKGGLNGRKIGAAAHKGLYGRVGENGFELRAVCRYEFDQRQRSIVAGYEVKAENSGADCWVNRVRCRRIEGPLGITHGARADELLIQTADQFPNPFGLAPEKQRHICLFIHGYNVAWSSAMATYGNVAAHLFDGADSLGELISFDWPSKGALLGYLPDRAEARRTGDDLTEVLSELYDWMSYKQQQTAISTANACKAKTSIIAHSMGNYALEYAMNAVWTRKNRPLLVSLLQEVLMGRCRCGQRFVPERRKCSTR
jgi:hypothetical protein